MLRLILPLAIIYVRTIQMSPTPDVENSQHLQASGKNQTKAGGRSLQDLATLYVHIGFQNWAGAVFTIMGFVLPDDDDDESQQFEILESMAQQNIDLSEEIKTMLKTSDFQDIRSTIETEYEDLKTKFKTVTTEFEQYEDWADTVIVDVWKALKKLNNILTTTTNGENIMESIMEDLIKIIKKDNIHTETLTRRMTNYFYSLQTWQALGYSLLMKAHEIKGGPSANDIYYKNMVSYISDQNIRMKEIMDSIDDSDSYLYLQDVTERESKLPFDNHEYVHLGEVVADDDKVVTGFQFYHHGNRLAIKIKQGVLKELGNIGEEDWKDETAPITADDKDGVHFAKFYDNEQDEHYYIDWSFIQAIPGTAIVGVKFCLSGSGSGRRVGLCIKTRRVNFSSGELDSSSDWTAPPWKNYKGYEGPLYYTQGWLWEKRDYWNIGDFTNTYKHYLYADADPVETNPPAMMTGIGLFVKATHTSSKKWWHLSIRAKDIFEFDESRLKSCEGDHSSYFVEHWHDTVYECCGGYIYNTATQVCFDTVIEDGHSLEPHYIDSGDAPTKYTDKMQCADDTLVEVDASKDEWEDNWDGCSKINSYIARCPFPYIPCEEMWSYKDYKSETIYRRDFKCGKNCEDKGGKRKTGNGDMKCYATPRSSGGKQEMRCANGNLESGWNGCVNEETTRMQCPKGHYPCNSLRSLSTTVNNIDYPEFICSTNCKDSDRALGCRELKCIGKPRDDDTILCDNGKTISTKGWLKSGWKGCGDKYPGSVRIQCPKNHYPCNERKESTGFTEFYCSLNCDKFGGKRTCYADSDGED